jgi:hypothetical protein
MMLLCARSQLYVECLVNPRRLQSAAAVAYWRFFYGRLSLSMCVCVFVGQCIYIYIYIHVYNIQYIHLKA